MEENNIIVNANWHEYIDLGLYSGNLWATCNLGADAPEKNGNFFQWGKIAPSSGAVGSEAYNNYNNNKPKVSLHGYLYFLEPEFDMASASMGGSWVLPTKDDFLELLKSCNIKMVNCQDNDGMLFESKINGNAIFFPFSGYVDDKHQVDEGMSAYLWTNQMNGDRVQTFTLMRTRPADSGIQMFEGKYGHSVRGVLHTSKNSHIIKDLKRKWNRKKI